MERWHRVGRFAAYGAALAMTPYLLIKLWWVAGSLAGALPAVPAIGRTTWIVVNVLTIGMAGIGIGVSLALARPWGMRIPARPLIVGAWLGTGFLVPVLPATVRGLLLAGDDVAGGSSPEGPVASAWENLLIQVGFAGMGIGLAIALPAYLSRRWPRAFTGRVGERSGAASGSSVLSWLPGLGIVTGLVWTYWGVGGTLGLADPASSAGTWRLLTLISGVWALLTPVAGWAILIGRPARLPAWIPLVLGWLGSGSLFAWGCWKLPLTVYAALARPDALAIQEPPALAAVLHAAAVIAGAAALWLLLRSIPGDRNEGFSPPSRRDRATGSRS